MQTYDVRDAVHAAENGEPLLDTSVVITVDVDPALRSMREPAIGDPWAKLDLIPRLEAALGDDLPPMTWMIRADDSMRVLVGSFAAGYLARPQLWESLRQRGHELAWHFHHWSYGSRSGFDPHPSWLGDAYRALSAHFPVRSTRTGWDYSNAATFQALDALGIDIDLSAIPGHLVWVNIEGESVVVDWRRAPKTPYHPSAGDYKRPGLQALRLLEVPIATFRASPVNVLKRLGWRVAHGVWSTAGIRSKVCYITDHWEHLPRPQANVIALYCHPDNFAGEGISRFARNLEALRKAFHPQFLTASTLADRLRQHESS